MAMQMEIDESMINRILFDVNALWFASTRLLEIIAKAPDVNVRSMRGDTPLHVIVNLPRIDAALELIKRGADINAIGGLGQTPLHRAVIANNHPAVCLLLYYNADVTIECENTFTPIMCAGKIEQAEIARTLLDYHRDWDYPDKNDGCKILFLFAYQRSPVAIDLVNIGVDVNCVNDFGEYYSPITYSIRYKTPELFKMLWTRSLSKILFHTFKPFLFIYATENNFSIDDKIDCLNFMLKSDLAFDLIREGVYFIKDNSPSATFLCPILMDLRWKYSKASDIKTLIQIFLSYGVEVSYDDVDHAVCAGFVGIASLLAYYSTTKPSNLAPILTEANVLSIFLSLTDTKNDYQPKSISKLLRMQLRLLSCYHMETNIRYVMGFFSLPRDYKHRLLRILKRYKYPLAFETLDALPEFPTLLEICRNNVRPLLLNGIEKPYVFYDAVERLPIPNNLKSILCFKTRLH